MKKSSQSLARLPEAESPFSLLSHHSQLQLYYQDLGVDTAYVNPVQVCPSHLRVELQNTVQAQVCIVGFARLIASSSTHPVLVSKKQMATENRSTMTVCTPC